MNTSSFDEVRHLRLMADKLRDEDKLTSMEWQRAQDELGALDRMYYAEEQVSDNPLKAVSLGMLVPAEYAAKSIGLTSGRSKPSLRQAAAGFRGIGRGLGNFRERAIASILRKPLRTGSSPKPENYAIAPKIDPVEWRTQMQGRADQLNDPNAAQLLQTRINALRP